jgi:hypothetical protein
MKIRQTDYSGIVYRSPITDWRVHYSKCSFSFQVNSKLASDVLKLILNLNLKQYLFLINKRGKKKIHAQYDEKSHLIEKNS